MANEEWTREGYPVSDCPKYEDNSGLSQPPKPRNTRSWKRCMMEFPERPAPVQTFPSIQSSCAAKSQYRCSVPCDSLFLFYRTPSHVQSILQFVRLPQALPLPYPSVHRVLLPALPHPTQSVEVLFHVRFPVIPLEIARPGKVPPHRHTPLLPVLFP